MNRVMATTRTIAALTFAGALCLGACSDDNGGGKDDDGKDADASGSTDTAYVPAVKLPGPCTSSYVSSKGKVTPAYIHRAYDGDKRLIEESTTAVAETLQATSWSHKFVYGSKGQVLKETYETSLVDEPNFEWSYSYDAKGRVVSQGGYETGWTRANCTIEYFGKSPDQKITGLKSGRICLYEVDNFDDDGNFTYTGKGKHIVTWDHGNGQVVEQWSEDGATTPDKIVTKFFDAKGNVTRVETEWALRGYSEHTVRYGYDDKNNLIKTEIDTDGDGTAESLIHRLWDKHGNELKVAFDDSADGKANRTWLHDYSCWAQ